MLVGDCEIDFTSLFDRCWKTLQSAKFSSSTRITRFLAVKEKDVDSLRGSVRRIKFEIKHHTSVLVFILCLGTTTKQSKVLYIS